MFLVGEGGLEPPRPFGHRNLNPARLPIPPLARVTSRSRYQPRIQCRPVGLSGFERRLERMVEGVFARAFRSGLRPVEIGRRMVREIDDNRSVDVRGRTAVPNHFSVQLSADDNERFAEIHDTLIRELCDAAREHARDEGYTFLGPVEVDFIPDDHMHTGAFQIEGRMREGTGGSGAGSLVLPTGERVMLTERVLSIGRMPESNIVLADPNVSRNHAEIRPKGLGYVLVDLNSTNGTKVNGVRVQEHDLLDGDQLSFGSTHMRFEAS